MPRPTSRTGSTSRSPRSTQARRQGHEPVPARPLGRARDLPRPRYAPVPRRPVPPSARRPTASPSPATARTQLRPGARRSSATSSETWLFEGSGDTAVNGLERPGQPGRLRAGGRARSTARQALRRRQLGRLRGRSPARARLLQGARDPNVVVITGDKHQHSVRNVPAELRRRRRADPVATEFVGSSITQRGRTATRRSSRATRAATRTSCSRTSSAATSRVDARPATCGRRDFRVDGQRRVGGWPGELAHLAVVEHGKPGSSRRQSDPRNRPAAGSRVRRDAPFAPDSSPFAALLAALVAAAAPAEAKLVAHGSVEQAYVLGAHKGAKVTLLDSKGKAIRKGKADRFGSRIFRALKPRGGYRVKSGGKTSRRFKVLRAGANPKRSFYARKHLRKGLNYVKVRDGVELAMTVRLPAGKTAEGRAVPDADRALRVPGRRAARPARGQAGRPARARVLDLRRRRDRAAARLRGGLGPDARLGLLGRRVRAVRPPDHLRRLRRGRDRRRAELGQGREGRHGRHLVLRHHAALRGRDAPAAPRGDRADVGQRRHLHRPGLPGRHLQRRLRQELDAASGWTTRSRRRAAASPTPARW